MSCLLYVDEEEASSKLNIDDLYEKKRQRDLKQLSIFNKILGRIHKRIQLTGRNKRNEKFIWFTVPEFLFGEPNYDNGECVAFLVVKLEENGFFVKYMHPNTLFVSWENWIPSYTRNEFKKKTGIVVDEKGNIMKKPGEEDEQPENDDPDARLLNIGQGKGQSGNPNKKLYTPIGQYKPTGNLVYNPEIMEKLEKKVSFS
jgi:hypothetical protein